MILLPAVYNIDLEQDKVGRAEMARNRCAWTLPVSDADSTAY